MRGPLAQEMAGLAAEQLLHEGRRDEAKVRFTALATQEGLWPIRAQLRLADIALREGKTNDCLARCQALLKAKKGDKTEVLTLMGRAYQLAGDHRRAAKCFAGEMPET